MMSNMKLCHKSFESSTKSWDTMLNEVETYVNGNIHSKILDPRNILNISIDASGP